MMRRTSLEEVTLQRLKTALRDRSPVLDVAAVGTTRTVRSVTMKEDHAKRSQKKISKLRALGRRVRTEHFRIVQRMRLMKLVINHSTKVKVAEVATTTTADDTTKRHKMVTPMKTTINRSHPTNSTLRSQRTATCVTITRTTSTVIPPLLVKDAVAVAAEADVEVAEVERTSSVSLVTTITTRELVAKKATTIAVVATITTIGGRSAVAPTSHKEAVAVGASAIISRKASLVLAVSLASRVQPT